MTGRRKKIYTSIITLCGIFFATHAAYAAVQIDHVFPRTANYFLNWSLTESQARELAKWDLVILDMEVQEQRPELLRKMHEWNPDIILLAYITPQEIVKGAKNSDSSMRRRLAQRIPDAWYLRDTAGTQLSFWPGTYLLNISDTAPKIQNKQLYQVMAEFASNDILGTGLWDGIFYDNSWDDIRWFVGDNADLDGNGAKDADLILSWQRGTEKLYDMTRTLTKNKYLIVANGTTRAYRNQVNGKMLENFIVPAWQPTMDTYAYNHGGIRQPQVHIINANTGNGRISKEDYQSVRFGLGSTLLEDGFFSYDYGDTDHGQLWWYDEYNANLGNPISNATSKQGHTTYRPDVWQRQFENGIAVVNSNGRTEVVDLGGEYEAIHGTQDPHTNNGSIVSELAVDQFDGRILLKTFSTLRQTLFPNGAFARFFRPDGARVRNGFFVFEEGYKGGDQIIHTDLNSDGKEDLLVVSGSKVQAWRHDGQLFFRLYPYTARYGGRLHVTIADLDNDSWKEIIVAPSSGHTDPIKIYQLNGNAIKRAWYPFGELHSHGYHVAVGEFGQGDIPRIIVASDVGGDPSVSVFDLSLTRLHRWNAFEAAFRGGVRVAAGDLDGDGEDEIVASPGPGKKPVIKTFSLEGNEIYPEFTAYSALGTPGIAVEVVDVDFDGKDDIVGLSEGI